MERKRLKVQERRTIIQSKMSCKEWEGIRFRAKLKALPFNTCFYKLETKDPMMGKKKYQYIGWRLGVKEIDRRLCHPVVMEGKGQGF